MSHIVTVRTQLRDPVAVTAACRRLGLPEPTHGTAQLYAGQTAEGMLVQLPGWKYPIAINTQNGSVQHDHFGGTWGDPRHLDRFLQAYAVEVVRIASHKQGYTLTEQLLPDGSIKLQIVEGGT